MKTKITTALVALLLAGAGTAALAQDREHEHSGGQAAPHAQAPQPHGPPPGAQPHDHWNGAPQGGMARGPAGPQTPAPAFQHRGGEGQHFQGQPPMAGGGAPQHFDRGAVPGPGANRQWDHERSAHEVIPPGPNHGQSYRADGHYDGRYEGHLNSHPGGVARDGYHGDARYNPWGGAGQRWQPGHAPPVFWSHDRYHAGNYRAPYGFFVRSWAFGDILPRTWYAQDYWIGDFLDYGLPYPPPGYEWVRVGGDALMIDRFTGRIVQVVRGIFW